ncbi:unnamed protein product [marine sediment metagenome]|uniref:Uncharacterized protein n=1 Tax=marine sediment metagenome TaxID=412755 RepID=X1QMX6_9ZZZZ
MESLPKTGRIFGVSIRLHHTWVLAFALITAIMVTQFPEALPLWQRVILGLVTGLLFLISVSIRSFIISLVAINRGIPIKRITLFVFGGGAEISKEATRPILELLIAVSPFLFFTGVEESKWFVSYDSRDCRLYIRSWAAPRNRVKVDWEIYRQGLLPEGVERNHYEVEIVTGTPLTSIKHVWWLTDDPRDVRLRVVSQAESPFRWFRAEWRVYAREPRERQIIDELLIDFPS